MCVREKIAVYASKYNSISVQLRSATWFLVCGVLQRGISVIVTPVFTRLMTTEEYGQYTLFTSWLEVLGILLTLRLYFGVFMQGLIRYDHNKDEYTASLQSLTTTIELVGLLIYLPLREFVNNLTGLTTPLMLCVFLSSWASAMFGFWSSRQRVMFRYRALVILTLAVALVQPLSGIITVLCFEAHKVEARVISMTIVQLCFFGWMFAYYLKKGGRFYNREYWQHALSFSIPLIPHYLSNTILNQSDRIMINAMIGASAAGIYGLAYSLSWAMNIVNQALLKTLDPWIYQCIRDRRYDDIARISYIALAGVGIINLMLVALAPEAIAIMAPESYRDGVWVVPPLALTVVVTFLYSLFADFEFYYERTSYVMLASVIGAVVNVGLNWYLLPRIGYQVTAYTTLIGYIVYVGMHYYFMRKVQLEEMNGVRVYNPRVFIAILMVVSLLATAFTLLYPYALVRYVLCGAAVLVAICKRTELYSLWKSARWSR